MVGASHFTLRCGRRLPDGSYQAPIVARVASLASSAAGLLRPEQAATLLHEFGHALHSLLSRTQFQHHFGAAAAPWHAALCVKDGRLSSLACMRAVLSCAHGAATSASSRSCPHVCGMLRSLVSDGMYSCHQLT